MLNVIATGLRTARTTVSERPGTYAPINHPQPAPSPLHQQRQLLLAVLGGLAYTVGPVLHPSIVLRLLRRIGMALGRSFHEQYEAAGQPQPVESSPPAREDLLACVEYLRTQWGCRLQLLRRHETHFDLTILDCPAEDQDTGRTHLCCLYAGILSEIVSQRLGQAAVSVQPRETPDKTLGALVPCRITIDFTRRGEPRTSGGNASQDQAAQQELVTQVAAMTTPLDRLSQRECTVLRLIGEGFTDKEIAAALRVSVRTAENHAARIYHKLGVRGRARLIRFALRHHVVEL